MQGHLPTSMGAGLKQLGVWCSLQPHPLYFAPDVPALSCITEISTRDHNWRQGRDFLATWQALTIGTVGAFEPDSPIIWRG